LKAVEKWGLGGKGIRRLFEGVEQNKVKYTHSRGILRSPFEY
jgi:hypothetical protein